MAKWSKQDYIMVAEVLREEGPDDTIRRLTSAFIKRFAKDNANFDPDRFIRATYSNEGGK